MTSTDHIKELTKEMFRLVKLNDGELLAKFLEANPETPMNNKIFGGTWLHTAASYGCCNAIVVLLRHYDVNIHGPVNDGLLAGGTPLHQAAIGNQPQAIQALLEHGANIDALDAHGCTPLVQAAAHDSGAAASALLRAGADASVPSATEPAVTALSLARERRSTSVLDALQQAEITN